MVRADDHRRQEPPNPPHVRNHRPDRPEAGAHSHWRARVGRFADWEIQNPVVKEAVKIVISPLLSTLSILNYVEINSEQEMLGYGIGVILLNVGMYFVLPTIVIIKSKNKIQKFTAKI